MRKGLSIHCLVARVFQICISFIPACIGLLGISNALIMKGHIINYVIRPLLSMKDLKSPDYANTWRAFKEESIIISVYYLMTLAEGLIGVLACIGIVMMTKDFFGSDRVFIKHQSWVRSACVLGFLVWGLGFFVMSGDFFLSWLSSSQKLQHLQVGGLHYAIILTLTYFFLKAHEKSLTI